MLQMVIDAVNTALNAESAQNCSNVIRDSNRGSSLLVEALIGRSKQKVLSCD
jgi:hypothetical protein